jgi:DNA-binding transcriptional MocR family regulator
MALNDLHMEEKAVVRFLADRGVLVSPGSLHFYNPPGHPCFRLSIAHLEETDILEGMGRLGRALADLYKKGERGA